MKKVLLVLSYVATAMVYAQIPTNGLVLYYPFSNNTIDSSGNNFNATGSSISFANGVLSQPNRSVALDGSNSRISYNKSSNNSAFDLQTYSISVWVNVEDMPNLYGNIFELGLANYLRFLRVGSGGYRIQAGYRDSSSQYRGVEAIAFEDSSIFRNKWNHIVYITYKQSSARVCEIYLNGRSIAVQTFSSTGINYLPADSVVNIGHRKGSTGLSFNGKMQDLALYNRNLTANEIEQLFNKSGCTTPTVFSLPNAPVVEQVCKGSSVNLTSAATGGAGITYKWYQNGITLPNQSSGTLNLTNTSALNEGVYRVSAVSNVCIKEVFSDYDFLVEVNPLDTPVISQVGDTLKTNEAGDEYKWVNANTNATVTINSAAGMSFIPPSNGNYSVIVKLGQCTKQSSTFSYSSGSVGINTIKVNNINVYPNPVKNILSIECDEEIQSIQVADVTGRIIITENNLSTRKAQLSTSDLAEATYIIHIKTISGKTAVKSFVKQ